jgi:hypothetical protein
MVANLVHGGYSVNLGEIREDLTWLSLGIEVINPSGYLLRVLPFLLNEIAERDRILKELFEMLDGARPSAETIQINRERYHKLGVAD